MHDIQAHSAHTAQTVMWFLMILTAALGAFRAWERSAVRRLRGLVTAMREEKQALWDNLEFETETRQEREEQWQRAVIDLARCERKLSRARVSRSRWQALHDEYVRLYRNEFKRCAQAEAKVAKLEFHVAYGEKARVDFGDSP